MFAHARCPVRIGIAGGGTDLPAWTREREGRCLSLAIATYTHAVAITRPDRQVVASYRQRDVARSATEIANGLIRESALMHGFQAGFEVHTLSEVSSQGSGLGVSSSIAVALAAVFDEMKTLRERPAAAHPKWRDGGEDAYRASRAREAWTVEIERLLRPVGRQDHMAAAWGGLRLYRFKGDGAEVERTFTRADAEWVAEHIAIVPLPVGHDASEILSGVRDPMALEHASQAVPLAIRAIEERSPVLLGQALSLGHASKREIPGAVPSAVAELVHRVEGVGVYGCKVAGAGGGGHLVVACEAKKRREVEIAVELPVMGVVADWDGVQVEGRA